MDFKQLSRDTYFEQWVRTSHVVEHLNVVFNDLVTMVAADESVKRTKDTWQYVVLNHNYQDKSSLQYDLHGLTLGEICIALCAFFLTSDEEFAVLSKQAASLPFCHLNSKHPLNSLANFASFCRVKAAVDEADEQFEDKELAKDEASLELRVIFHKLSKFNDELIMQCLSKLFSSIDRVLGNSNFFNVATRYLDAKGVLNCEWLHESFEVAKSLVHKKGHEALYAKEHYNDEHRSQVFTLPLHLMVAALWANKLYKQQQVLNVSHEIWQEVRNCAQDSALYAKLGTHPLVTYNIASLPIVAKVVNTVVERKGLLKDFMAPNMIKTLGMILDDELFTQDERKQWVVFNDSLHPFASHTDLVDWANNEQLNAMAYIRDAEIKSPQEGERFIEELSNKLCFNTIDDVEIAPVLKFMTRGRPSRAAKEKAQRNQTYKIKASVNQDIRRITYLEERFCYKVLSLVDRSAALEQYSSDEERLELIYNEVCNNFVLENWLQASNRHLLFQDKGISRHYPLGAVASVLLLASVMGMHLCSFAKD